MYGSGMQQMQQGASMGRMGPGMVPGMGGSSMGGGMMGAGYGNAVPFSPEAVLKSGVFRGNRKRMNLGGVCMSLFLPWVTFSLIYANMSFKLHYDNPSLCYFIDILGLIAVLVFVALAGNAVRKRISGDMEKQPTWFVFLALSMVVAYVFAFSLGDLNYYDNLRPYYDIKNLNTYPNVDPAVVRGQEAMDAGRITFTEGTKLDLTKSMSFKNLETYCVAPITSGNKTLGTYDFWAVGLNCCPSLTSTAFQCGEYNNPKAHGGLRLMNDGQRAFYRLAVQQAETAYGIKAVHPLFFYWMADPIAEMDTYEDDGVKYFMLGVFAHFSFQLFMVITASFAFAKLGYF